MYPLHLRNSLAPHFDIFYNICPLLGDFVFSRYFIANTGGIAAQGLKSGKKGRFLSKVELSRLKSLNMAG